MRTLTTARDVAGSVLLGVLLALPTPTAAQHSTQLSVFGGVATDQLGQRSNAVGIAPTLTFAPSANLSTQLAGNATRFATDAWSLGGNLSFAGRDPVGSRFALTLRGDGNVSRLQGTGSGTYAQGELSPGLELNVSRATLFGGARVIGGSASQQARIPGPGLFGPTTQTTQVSRSGGGALYGVAVTLVDDGATSVAVSAREDRTSVPGAAFTDRTAVFAFVRDGISLSASGGIRRASDERDAFGGASLILPLASSTALEIAGGRYASNRVLGTPAGQFMSIGLSLRFGRDREPELPKAVDVPPPGRGMTRLTIRAPEARTVEVAGDFNKWKPVSARRAPNGVWYADLRVPPGRYRYAFRVNGAEWRVPDGATAVDDGFGGKSAWLSVGEGRAK